MLSSFHLNGNTQGFQPQNQTLEQLQFVQHDKQRYWKVLLSSFQLNGHTTDYKNSGPQRCAALNKHHRMKVIVKTPHMCGQKL